LTIPFFNKERSDSQLLPSQETGYTRYRLVSIAIHVGKVHLQDTSKRRGSDEESCVFPAKGTLPAATGVYDAVLDREIENARRIATDLRARGVKYVIMATLCSTFV